VDGAVTPRWDDVMIQPRVVALPCHRSARHLFHPIPLDERAQGWSITANSNPVLYCIAQRLGCPPRRRFRGKLVGGPDFLRSPFAVLPIEKVPSLTAFVEHNTSLSLPHRILLFWRATDGATIVASRSSIKKRQTCRFVPLSL